MTAEGFSLDTIGQISVNATDIERATAFYRDVLGITYLFQAGTMSFFDCGGIRLMLGVAESPEYAHPSSILYFRVADIQRSHGTLADQGVEFVHEPRLVHKAEDHDLWMGFFRDSEGNVLALMSEVARA